MVYELQLREIELSFPKDKKLLTDFLAQFDLSFPEDVDESIGYFAGDQLVATCSLSGKVLKGFAISEQYQGSNLTASLVTEMVKRLSRRGIFKSFVFTKKENREIFTAVGYNYLAAGGNVVLLENGLDTVADYQKQLRKYESNNTINGCIIMNCNPFTRGHRYLIENAAKQCEILYIFVVQEDQSVFPFAVRKRLVEEGTGDIDNVIVLAGGDYIISAATFPGYFIKRKDEMTKSQALLDIDIFTKYIAPVLKISKRFVGNEPYDQLTAVYNQVMAEVLPAKNIDFIEIPRFEVNDRPVSASRVRELLKQEPVNREALTKLVPPTTLDFLTGPEGTAIIRKIRGYTHG
ncbi:MAG: [citrate (pro-3S)-lyase] ligase [bacterium]|jgi:[citrate (pro-3S)-lyase] ligase